MMNNQHTVIQRLVLPTNSGLALPENLYHSGRVRVQFGHAAKSIQLGPDSHIDLMSFFNAFSISYWRSVLDPSSLGLCIDYRGDLKIAVKLHREKSGPACIYEIGVESETGNSAEMIDIFAGLGAVQTNEIVSVTLSSNKGCEVNSCSWFTSQRPRTDTKLGIIITHFNRQKWVMPAIARFRRELLQDRDFSKLCALVVVDNSCNLDLPEVEGLTHIRSYNYGCSGGFAKGLSHLAEAGQFTHALFMDDDATCEIESIKRIVNFYQFSASDRTALAGTLFCEPHFDRIYEAGASWGATWQPKFHKKEASGNNLLRLASGETGAAYGGWWMFGFPMKKTLKWPFPFFVRGDDVTFSIANNFKILCPLGVASWAESFRVKDSPWLKYLDGRMHAMPVLVFKTAGLIAWLKTLSITVLGCVQSYRYSSANMFLAGLRDSLRDKDFWEKNADVNHIKSKYAPIIAEETYHCSQESALLASRSITKEPAVRKIVRLATLGGYLLPKCFLKSSRAFIPKEKCNRNKLIFPYYHIRLFNRIDGTTCDLQRNHWKALSVTLQIIALYPLLIWHYYLRQDRHKRLFRELTTKESWDKRFSQCVGDVN